MMLFAAALAITSCTNHSTANILITNHTARDLSSHTVTVSLSTIHERLQTQPSDTIILLNEENIPVQYTFNADRTSIVFRVPMVRARSQKTYSINRKHSSLKDNILTFRTENIIIEIK
ncbi:MAG: hypothetical protein ACI3Y5_05335 [Prevotella sp.]